jgi:hypothetical protein
MLTHDSWQEFPFLNFLWPFPVLALAAHHLLKTAPIAGHVARHLVYNNVLEINLNNDIEGTVSRDRFSF